MPGVSAPPTRTAVGRNAGSSQPARTSGRRSRLSSVVVTPGAGRDLPRCLSSALLSTGLATLIYFRLVQGPGPAFISIVNYLVPGMGGRRGALFLGESISPLLYLGMVLILSGIALGELGPRMSEDCFNERRCALISDA